MTFLKTTLGLSFAAALLSACATGATPAKSMSAKPDINKMTSPEKSGVAFEAMTCKDLMMTKSLLEAEHQINLGKMYSAAQTQNTDTMLSIGEDQKVVMSKITTVKGLSADKGC